MTIWDKMNRTKGRMSHLYYSPTNKSDAWSLPLSELCSTGIRLVWVIKCLSADIQAPLYLWCNDIPGALSLGSLEQVYSGCLYIVLSALGLTESTSDFHVFVFELFCMYLFVCILPSTLRLKDYEFICICLYCICIYLYDINVIFVYVCIMYCPRCSWADRLTLRRSDNATSACREPLRSIVCTM